MPPASICAAASATFLAGGPAIGAGDVVAVNKGTGGGGNVLPDFAGVAALGGGGIRAALVAKPMVNGC